MGKSPPHQPKYQTKTLDVVVRKKSAGTQYIRIIAKNHWKITAWLSAASVKQQVADPWPAFLVCSSQQCNCIYFLQARAQEDINKSTVRRCPSKQGFLKFRKIQKEDSHVLQPSILPKGGSGISVFLWTFEKNAFLT